MSRISLVLAAASAACVLISGCGSADETADEAGTIAAADGQTGEVGADSAAADRDDPFKARLEKRAKERAAAQAAATPEEALRRQQMDEAMESMRELERIRRNPDSTEADKKAAMERMLQAAKKPGRRDRSVKQPVLSLPPDWAATSRIEKNAKEAELLVQVGDIDNLGFGWPDEFDPFSGKSTPIHAFPWKPEADDPPGTDRIMVNSGAQTVLRSKDGYTRDTDRPDNSPQPITIQFDPATVQVKGALLQLFVDDFQAPVMKTRFSVTLDGRPAPDIETTINKLNQTGPVGKLITIKLLPEYLGLLSDGKLQIMVDDATSNIGDGFAFDFARLLINPKGFVYSGTIRGIVVDRESEAPINGALASAGNVRQATTDVDGRFNLQDVPAGLVVVTGSHPDYVTGSEQTDLLAGETVDLTIRLERAKNETLADRLESDGKVDLYGIYFDTDKAVLKAESGATLQQVLQLLKSKPTLRIAIAGHTDAQASDTYNADLSKRRAQAVMAWLTTRGIVTSRLTAQGFGESQPVADNSSAAGRALNRRVEIRDLSR